jgi:hypothetical protein
MSMWPPDRNLRLEGRVVISQVPTDPGDIGEPRISTADDVTYVSVPEFELWPTDPDWQPHDASVVYITRRSLTMHPPGRLTYHVVARSTRYSYRTGCGIELWSSGWEPGQQSAAIAIRRDVASRIARPCRVCGSEPVR